MSDHESEISPTGSASEHAGQAPYSTNGSLPTGSHNGFDHDATQQPDDSADFSGRPRQGDAVDRGG